MGGKMNIKGAGGAWGGAVLGGALALRLRVCGRQAVCDEEAPAAASHTRTLCRWPRLPQGAPYAT